MSPRVGLALAAVVLAGLAASLFLGRSPEAPVPAGPAATAGGAVPEAPEAPAKKPPRGGKPWVLRGTGSVEGTLREFGTDRPLGGVKVRLAAGIPGPGTTLEATTLADGSF